MSWRLVALCLAVAALAAGGIAALIALNPGGGGAPATRTAIVGSARFTLPAGYFRPQSRGGGRLERLDLAAFFPDFTPAGDNSDIDAGADLAERYQKLVFIDIRAADSSLDPADRPAKLYARFLEADRWSHPGGLEAAGFQAGSPFEGQELYFVAPEGRAFAARCGRPDPARTTPNACAYDFRVDGLDVELRFPAALLSEWRTLNDGARGLIAAGRR
jgi:hypothetical protein